jgi:hypothetical protein
VAFHDFIHGQKAIEQWVFFLRSRRSHVAVPIPGDANVCAVDCSRRGNRRWLTISRPRGRSGSTEA